MLLDANYTARLADFGYASLIGNIPEALAYLQRSTIRPGALRWTAPEQIDSEKMSALTTKSDIYSFGCLALQGSANGHEGSVCSETSSPLLQVLSGKQPWSEVKRDVAVMLCLVKRLKPGRPLSRVMDDSHWNFILNCWSPIEERPAAQTIILSIRQFLDRCPPFPLLYNLLVAKPNHKDSLTDTPSLSVGQPTVKHVDILHVGHQKRYRSI